MNGETSNEAGGSMASSVESGVGAYDPPRSPAFAMADGDFGDLPANCFTFDPAMPTDADLDGYPDVPVTVTVSCLVTASNGEFDVAGSYLMADLNPTVASLEYRNEYDGTVVFTGLIPDIGPNFQGVATFTSDGIDTGSQSDQGGGTIQYRIHQGGRSGMDLETPDGGLVYRTSERTDWDLGYIPAIVWDRGTDMVAGSVEISGGWEVEVVTPDHHQRAESTVETLTPLQVVGRSFCPTHVVSGSVRASFRDDGGDAAIDVTWNGCGDHSVTYLPPGG